MQRHPVAILFRQPPQGETLAALRNRQHRPLGPADGARQLGHLVLDEVEERPDIDVFLLQRRAAQTQQQRVGQQPLGEATGLVTDRVGRTARQHVHPGSVLQPFQRSHLTGGHVALLGQLLDQSTGRAGVENQHFFARSACISRSVNCLLDSARWRAAGSSRLSERASLPRKKKSPSCPPWLTP